MRAAHEQGEREQRARRLAEPWAARAKAKAATAKLNEKMSDNRRLLAERKRRLEEQLAARLQQAREMNAREAAQAVAQSSWRHLRAFQRSYVRALQAEHTIVAAVAPNAEDSAGDHLRDENIIQIFFSTMISELCVLCMLRGGASVPVLSITTVINGAITTGACSVVAMLAKRLFRWGNKLRWRKKDRKRESAATLIQRRFRLNRKERRKRKKGLKACVRRCVRRVRRLVRRCIRRLCECLCRWRVCRFVRRVCECVSRWRMCRCIRRVCACVCRWRVCRWLCRRVGRSGKDKYAVQPRKPRKAARPRAAAPAAAPAKPAGGLKSLLTRAAAASGAPGAADPDGLGKITSFAELVRQKQREEHALFGRFPLTAPHALGPRASAKWVTMHPKLHLLRFTLAWGINLAVYFAACLAALVYGVLFQAPAFTELLLAWVLALGFTWAVIEPSEVLGLVLFPTLANNKRLQQCRAKCKDLGFF